MFIALAPGLVFHLNISEFSLSFIRLIYLFRNSKNFDTEQCIIILNSFNSKILISLNKLRKSKITFKLLVLFQQGTLAIPRGCAHVPDRSQIANTKTVMLE